MPAKELVVENGFMITATPQGPGIPNSATFQYVKIPGGTVKAGNQTVLVQNLTVIGTACSSPAGLCTGSGVITATAAKTQCNKMPALRTGDTGTCSGMALIPAGTSVTTTSSSCKLEITLSGQMTVKGE